MEELKITLDNTYCHVIKFGHGPRDLIILPGISLCGLQGQGEAVEKAYQIFENDFTCYLIDVRKDVKPGFTLDDIARDVYTVAYRLGIYHCSIYGVSLGGMIGVLLEEKYPNYLDGFVVCSSLCKTTKKMFEVAQEWKTYAVKYDVVGLNKSFFEHCYSKEYLKNFDNFMDSLLHQGTPKECDRFAVLCDILCNIDLVNALPNIGCKTLVLGGTNDDVIGPEGSYQLADILACDIYMYDSYAHTVYDEAPDIKERIYNFLMENYND